MTSTTDRLIRVRDFMRGFFDGDERAASVLLELDLAIAATMPVGIHDEQNRRSPARLLAACFDESDHDGITEALNDLTAGLPTHVGGGAAPEFVIERASVGSMVESSDTLLAALRFYADPKSYRAAGHPQIDADAKPINGDKGDLARKAIADVEGRP